MQVFYVSGTIYTHSLKAILYFLLNNFVHEAKFHGVEFSPCGVTWMLKKFGILEFDFLDQSCSVVLVTSLLFCNLMPSCVYGAFILGFNFGCM